MSFVSRWFVEEQSLLDWRWLPEYVLYDRVPELGNMFTRCNVKWVEKWENAEYHVIAASLIQLVKNIHEEHPLNKLKDDFKSKIFFQLPLASKAYSNWGANWSCWWLTDVDQSILIMIMFYLIPSLLPQHWDWSTELSSCQAGYTLTLSSYTNKLL